MVANDPSAVLNAVICGVIVIVLMLFYRRGTCDFTIPDFVTGLCHGAGICQRPFRFVLVYMNHPTGWW